jgi:hypothetical protein
MIGQRPSVSAACVQGVAEALPLRDVGLGVRVGDRRALRRAHGRCVGRHFQDERPDRSFQLLRPRAVATVTQTATPLGQLDRQRQREWRARPPPRRTRSSACPSRPWRTGPQRDRYPVAGHIEQDGDGAGRPVTNSRALHSLVENPADSSTWDCRRLTASEIATPLRPNVQDVEHLSRIVQTYHDPDITTPLALGGDRRVG